MTYLYKALLAKVRSMNLIAIATATFGIATSTMPGRRTAHSRFKIPIKLDNKHYVQLYQAEWYYRIAS